jgi:GTP cyclohydrolase I
MMAAHPGVRGAAPASLRAHERINRSSGGGDGHVPHPVHSLCEHHLMPFAGVAHVGYLPGERIVGTAPVRSRRKESL